MLQTLPTRTEVRRESAPSLDVDAFNAAFDDLELDWHWDQATAASLAAQRGERECVLAYLHAHRPHLLHVYEAAALVDLILAAKARHARPAAPS